MGSWASRLGRSVFFRFFALLRTFVIIHTLHSLKCVATSREEGSRKQKKMGEEKANKKRARKNINSSPLKDTRISSGTRPTHTVFGVLPGPYPGTHFVRGFFLDDIFVALWSGECLSSTKPCTDRNAETPVFLPIELR